MTKQPTLTAKVTHVRRTGLARVALDGRDPWSLTKNVPLYTITYWRGDFPHDVPLIDDGKGGFVAKIERAVREDLERRRYIEERDVHLTLPMEVNL